jgi:hypothetical protein
VTTPLELVVELVVVPPVLTALVAPPELEEAPPELEDELLPTVSPTLAFTAVIVPLIGARSTVSPTAFSAAVTAL